jgi:undecaprenyl-phosphate 4-deoxy-4-formamido-L-arabinose transferase
MTDDRVRSSLSVVVPVYNSAVTLPVLLQRLQDALADFPAAEIVLVDDGSRDASWAIVDGFAKGSRNVTALRMAKNFGQHAALLAGLRAAAGEVCVTLDDDLQNPPEEIPKLYAALVEGEFDLVYGTPQAETHGFVRDALSRFTKFALSLATSSQTARSVSAFRIMRRHVVDDLRHVHVHDVLLDVMLSWVTANVGAVRVRNEPRRAGKSAYSPVKLVRHGISMITGYSTLPLRFATVLGLSLTLFGGGSLLYVFAALLIVGRSVPGFPYLVSIVTIFAGAELLTLGIFGEYLARLFTRSMGQPLYVVRAVSRSMLERSRASD